MTTTIQIVPYRLLTAEQASKHYHTAYDNQAYTQLTDSIRWLVNIPATDPTHDRHTNSAYLDCCNLLTDAALGICGHPAHRDAGGQLTRQLLTILEPRIDNLSVSTLFAIFKSVNTYLDLYRAYMLRVDRQISVDALTDVQAHLQVAQQATDDAMRSASRLPNWWGRATYHLLAAASNWLLAATQLSRITDYRFPRSHLHYIGEKLAGGVERLDMTRYEIRQSGLDGLGAFYTDLSDDG